MMTTLTAACLTRLTKEYREQISKKAKEQLEKSKVGMRWTCCLDTN